MQRLDHCSFLFLYSTEPGKEKFIPILWRWSKLWRQIDRLIIFFFVIVYMVFNVSWLMWFYCLSIKIKSFSFSVAVKDVCQPNPCYNGGNCAAKGNRYTCTCTKDFSGEQCSGNTFYKLWGFWLRNRRKRLLSICWFRNTSINFTSFTLLNQLTLASLFLKILSDDAME